MLSKINIYYAKSCPIKADPPKTMQHPHQPGGGMLHWFSNRYSQTRSTTPFASRRSSTARRSCSLRCLPLRSPGITNTGVVRSLVTMTICYRPTNRSRKGSLSAMSLTRYSSRSCVFLVSTLFSWVVR